MPPGVLLVGLGRATRLMRFLTALPKTYVAEIVLGTATSTLDASGEVVGEWDMSAVTPDQVRAAAADAHGDHRADPAHGVGRQDRRAAAARAGPAGDRGRTPAPQGARSTASTSSPIPDRPGVYRAEVECSSGTYIRVLAEDIGTALGRRGPHRPVATHPHRLVRRERDAPARPPHPRRRPHAGPGHARPGRRDGRAGDRRPRSGGACRSTGCRSARWATGPGPCWTSEGNLLAVYEATGTDRIKPAVVMAGS